VNAVFAYDYKSHTLMFTIRSMYENLQSKSSDDEKHQFLRLLKSALS